MENARAQFTKHDTTEDRVATLHSLLNDAAKKVGAQRQTISELLTALIELNDIVKRNGLAHSKRASAAISKAQQGAGQ